MGLAYTLKFILNHPLNRDRKVAALERYVRWQVGSRLLHGAAVMPFVDDSTLVVSTGMSGATMFLYTGLSDFADCSLLLHLLQPGDLFIDIGSNVGAYTVLASAVRGAQSVAIEPLPSTYSRLLMNVSANRIEPLVEALNIGLSRTSGSLRFTADADTANHVVTEADWKGPTVEVPVRRLDDVLAGRHPTLIKIDVEGWEGEVIASGEQVLAQPSLLGLIVEMDGTRETFNASEQVVHDTVLRHGFLPYEYDPFTRKLARLPSKNLGHNNTLYLRNVPEIEARVAVAKPFTIHGRSI